MKKMLMIAAMMVATMSASAQFEPGTWSIQPKVGMNLSKVSNMPKFNDSGVNVDRSLYAGFVIGGEFEYQVAKPFSLAAGLNFSMQGCQWDDYDVTEDGIKYEYKDNRIELNYINLPIVANIYLFKGFAIKGGVQLGYLVSGNVKNTEKANNETRDVDFKIYDFCNKFDVSIPVGISYQVPTIPIYIDGRAIFGLTDIIKKENVAPGYKNIKNQVFQLTVGYKFAL